MTKTEKLIAVEIYLLWPSNTEEEKLKILRHIEAVVLNNQVLNEEKK